MFRIFVLNYINIRLEIAINNCFCYLSNYYYFFIFYYFCFLVVFWEKSCFEFLMAKTVLIGCKLILWFFLLICWLIYWISLEQLIVEQIFFERLIQQSISCFKEIRVFDSWLTAQPCSYLHRRFIVTLYLFLQWLIITLVFNECSGYYSKLKYFQM